MEAHDLGGLIVFVGESIRYVTATCHGNWRHNMYFAIETSARHPGIQQTVRLEENVLAAPTDPSSSPCTRWTRGRPRDQRWGGGGHRPPVPRA
jgi:hypothetical protein